MLENPKCTACPLHAFPYHRCMLGKGTYKADTKLLILIDHPTQLEDRKNAPMSGAGVELIHWMFARMGLPKEAYYLEYVVKCCPKEGKMPSQKADRLQAVEACSAYRYATMQVLEPKVVVGLGKLSCEALIGHSEIDKYQGTYWTSSEFMTRNYSEHVWIGPNVNAVLMNPGIAQELYRILWKAAEHAGYLPQTTKIKPFDWSEFIK